MSKKGVSFLGLIILGSFVFLWLIKAPIMSHYLTRVIGVHVKIRTISLWPTVTTMSHFRISNPQGYKTPTAFEVNKTQINYRWKALTGDPREIDLITLKGVFLNITLNSALPTDNNWTDIGAHLKRGEGKEVLIHKLLLQDVTVKTEGKGAKLLGIEGTQHFDQIVLNEIDSKKGFPTKELVSQIFEGIGLRQFIEKFLNPAKQIEKALSPLKIFGKAPESQGLIED